jgi:hypothetical protein
MPGFDAHLKRLNSTHVDLLRDRIMEAASLSKDGKVCGFERWVQNPDLGEDGPDTRVKVMAQDEGGCQIYVKLKPAKSKLKLTRWSVVKRIPLLHLSEEQLLWLKRFVWHPSDPENPLVVLARCAK